MADGDDDIAEYTSGARICEKGGAGVVFPLFGEAEQEWPRGLRITLYFLGLAWCFMGVAIIADIFMGAIEKVTSKKVRMFDRKKQRFYTFEVWNATVANLTLMALGSSAPEILLNVIDIFAKEFYLEGLGPGTIVGSAAFNLLMIIAVCIVAIPKGEVRQIKEMPVYVCTASWSVFAYFWMLLILVVISPNVVEVWEGVLTFLFFPVLTFMAFAADKGWIVQKKGANRISVHADISPEELAEAEERVRAEHGKDLTPEQVARVLAVMNPVKRTRAQYRASVTGAVFGGKRPPPNKVKQTFTKSFTMRSLSFITKTNKVVPFETVEDTVVCTLEFKNDTFPVLENAGEAVARVVRKGKTDTFCRVRYITSDGNAVARKDYVPQDDWLDFPEGVTEGTIRVPIIDNQSLHDDKDFFISLSIPQVLQANGEVDKELKADIGPRIKTSVVIIDDDDAGVVSFEKDEHTIYQRDEEFVAPIVVKRKVGGCGKVSVAYSLEGDSAIPGRDFVAAEGRLDFDHNEMQAKIEVTIKAVPRYETKDRFRVLLFDPQGGLKLDTHMDGGSQRNILTVTIEADPESRQRVDRVWNLLQAKWQRSKVGQANWASQFKEALYVNGGQSDDDDEEDSDTPRLWDYIGHGITVPWKLLFALVPPTDFCGGWLCFYVALLMIGFVTMLINDLAALLGCVMCLPDEITAITFVAMGTSLPDTFASKTAAEQDPYADASIGNVTGSNSVNVFLGLGLPWMIASIYWAGKGYDEVWQARYQFASGLDFLGPAGRRTQGFVVEAGSLSFSVAIFACCATVCLVLLQTRRILYGGELGGPARPKWVSSGLLCGLWLFYIGISSWKSLSEEGGFSCR